MLAHGMARKVELRSDSVHAREARLYLIPDLTRGMGGGGRGQLLERCYANSIVEVLRSWNECRQSESHHGK